MNSARSTTTVAIAIDSSDEPTNSFHGHLVLVLKCRGKSLANRLLRHSLEKSVYIRIGDYWVIGYQGEAAILKAARGLDYLAYLLRSPNREVHVTELLDTFINHATLGSGGNSRATSSDARTARPQVGLPILDSQAKLEYKRRLCELREDAEEAVRFNDSYRAAKIRREMSAVAEQLVAAVGFGSRDRRFLSDAERARSAVTKRIKEAIHRIEKVTPALGRHLAARIKTGYFCSYSPHPDRPIAWSL
jgi:hypothetical protein